MASTLQNLLKNKAVKDAENTNRTKIDSSANQSQLVPPATTTDHSQPVPTPTKSKVPTSPVKNFTKVPNSVTSEAIPQGMFKGLSKHTYDVLYKLTRGAINPRREVQLTRLELIKLTRLSENTQRAHVKYLSVAGLLKITYHTGKHEGAIYEVLVPEELDTSIPTNPYQVVPTTANQYQPKASTSKEYQNLVPVTSQNLVGVSTTDFIDNKEVNNPIIQRETKNKNDDEVFGQFLEKFQSVSEELTGKKLSGNDSANLAKLADLLILELRMAARRTGNISSIPAFLTEILRRKLREQQPSTKVSKVKIDTIGKPESESYEIKPLDKKGREAALEQLREFGDDDFLEDFKKWYTEEDWKWLTENLK
jgi:hypothetical protein